MLNNKENLRVKAEQNVTVPNSAGKFQKHKNCSKGISM